MELKKRRCKTCGCSFVPKDRGERFCSPVCKTAGLFLGGGGDTSKPGSTAFSENADKTKVAQKRIKSDDEKFAKVRAMFQLPVSERYEIAKDFTKEEADYARRIARRMMAEDDRISREISWTGDFDDEASAEEPGETFWDNSISESDDGSI